VTLMSFLFILSYLMPLKRSAVITTRTTVRRVVVPCILIDQFVDRTVNTIYRDNVKPRPHERQCRQKRRHCRRNRQHCSRKHKYCRFRRQCRPFWRHCRWCGRGLTRRLPSCWQTAMQTSPTRRLPTQAAANVH